MAQPPQEQASVDFFISHTGVDRRWAEWIGWQLEDAGYRVILDVWDFRAGISFVGAMEAAASKAERTLLVASPDYFNARYTTPEWEAAFVQDSRGQAGTLLPVIVRACELPVLLQRLVHIDLVGLDRDAAKAQLLARVSHERPKPEHEPLFPGEPAQRPPEPRFPGALPPIWNVPHDRNPNFTGRTELLSELHDSLHAGNATVLRQALRGLGGVGKTQLALEYAYRHAAAYSVVWWVPSETSPATVYAELTRELGLPEADANESDVRAQAVKRWLEQHAGWLLVFDNAVEPDAVKPYLPQGQGGHVIITSRYWDWGEVASGLGVEVFDRDTESVPFLLLRTGQTDEAAARGLADALGNLPLALAQAAAYIASTGTTLEEYTELFETRRDELWAEEEAPGDYPVPVGATWSLAMDEVKNEPGAAELMNLLAYFASEPVSRDWLLEGAEHLPEPLGSLVQDRLAWNRIGRAFRRYGLVEVTESGLLVHRLVQAVTRDRLAEAERQAWAAAAVQVVVAVYPEDTYSPRDISIWERCGELLGHAIATVDSVEALGVTSKTIGRFLGIIAQYLDSQGRYAESGPLYQRALAIYKEKLGVNHPTVVRMLSNLSVSKCYQGRSAEAELPLQRIIEMDKQVYGPDHPNVAVDLNNLAFSYHNQGRSAQAEPLYQRALAIYKEKCGVNHPTVVRILINLATLYREQARYEEAESLAQQALRIGEKVLSSDHPVIATGINILGLIYHKQGCYSESELHFQRALRIWEETLGRNHPDVAKSLSNLASLYQDQGRDDEAESLFEQALKINEEMLGASHPHVAIGYNNLATHYRRKGRYNEAESCYERALRTSEEVLGNDHPDVATKLNNLANLYRDQGRNNEAGPLYERALQIGETTLGCNHPSVALYLQNLGSLYQCQGLYLEAEPLYQRSLAIADAALGPDHPNTQRIRRNYNKLRQQRDAASDPPSQPPG